MKKTLTAIIGTLPLFYGIMGCNAQESSKTNISVVPTSADVDSSKKIQPVSTAYPTLVDPQVPAVPTGAKGAQGSVSGIDRWTFYRDYIFDDNRSDFHPSDLEKSAEIARFIKANPSLKIGIDGFINQQTIEIDERRIATVRDSLISAGIPDSKIEKGTFGNPKYARKQRVAILIRTAN